MPTQRTDNQPIATTERLNTLFVGKVRQHFAELPSTNVFAQEWLAQHRAAEGTLISTDHQTQGRGQMGNRWESAAGQNMALSFIFYPHFIAAHQQFDLNRAVALAVADFVRQQLPTAIAQTVSVKWSNDIYVGAEKIAGILIQNTLNGNYLQNTIVGIGVNVHQCIFPSGLQNATSLYLQTQQSFDLEILTQQLCQTLEQRYLQLKAHKNLADEYHAQLYQLGEWATYRRLADDTLFVGRITGVQATGQLQIEDLNKRTHLFEVKQIKFEPLT